MLHASSFLQHVCYSSCGFGSHNYVLDGLNKVIITQDKTWNYTCWVPKRLDLGWFSLGAKVSGFLEYHRTHYRDSTILHVVAVFHHIVAMFCTLFTKVTYCEVTYC